MALINLSLTSLNADGSTTVFGEQGNAIEDIYSGSATTVFAEPLASTDAMSTPVWYAPAPTSQYFQNLLNNPQFFETIGGIRVFKMYLGLIFQPDAIVKAFFAYLSAHDVKLGLEAPALVANPGQPGSGIEGFAPTNEMLQAVTRIKALGGTLDYISWDEPLYFGSNSTGIYTMAQVAAQVAASASAVRAIFPNIRVGDIEPVDAVMDSPTTLQAWFAAYAAASGTQFTSFLADTNTGRLGWQSNLASTIAVAHADGIPVGAIIVGLDAAPNDNSWAATAVANALEMLSDPALRPDYLDVQSWQIYPSESPDADVPGTLASVAADVAAGENAALAIPAAAHYAASGILQSVTWSGGWTASENGTSLAVTSPTGNVLAQFAWGDVQVFAFEPDTGTVSLMIRTDSDPFSQGTTYAVGLAAGTLVFTPGASASGARADVLTLTLASASTMGFAGCGITNQTNPTLTGTAPPNSTIQLQIDGNSAGTVVASATGVWTFAIAAPLTAGAHLIEATGEATSSADSQQTSYVVSVDPNLRLWSTLGLAQGSDTGYPDDGITDDTQPVFCGVDDPDVKIVVAIDGSPVGTATTDANGNWTVTPPAPLPVGTYTVTVTAVGSPGTSSTPGTMQLVIDTPVQEAAMTSPDPLFDAAWYLQQHPGIASSAPAAYTQYMTTGWKEGFDPSPFFSTSYYLKEYPDVAAAGVNPLLHFEIFGWKEGRNPSSTFNTTAYEAANPGLPAGEDPLVAYIDSLTVSTPTATVTAASAAVETGSATSTTSENTVVAAGNDVVAGANNGSGDSGGSATAGDKLSGSSDDGDQITLSAPSRSVTSGGIDEHVFVSALNPATGGSVGDPHTVKLDAATNLTLSLVRIIHAVGSNGNDTIAAGATNQTLTGGSGTDTLIGYAGGYDRFQDTANGLDGDMIKNFLPTDQIDITNLIPGGATLTATPSKANSAVTVVSGITRTSFLMSGSFAQSGFTLTTDGAGGTILTHT